MDNINLLSTLAVLYLGMVGLNLSMDKHFKQVFGQKISINQSRILKVLGWLGLVLSLIGCIAVWGIVIGIAAWFGIATFIVGLLIYLESYRPTWVKLSAIGSLVVLLGLQVLRLF